MVFWNGVRPLPRETEDKTLREMCIAYVAICNPSRAEPEPNQITRRCQHCQTIFQQPASIKLQHYCLVCR